VHALAKGPLVHEISIDTDVYRRLAGMAEPFVDTTPNHVLRRLLVVEDTAPGKPAAKTQRPAGRAARGSLLPEAAYEKPILQALVSAGGSGAAKDVIAAVGARLSGSMTAEDKAKVPSGAVRWVERTRAVRGRLVKEGKISASRSYGLWEITEAGRRHLADA